MPFTTPTLAGMPVQVTPTGYLAKRVRPRPSALPTPAELHAENASNIRPLTAEESAHIWDAITRGIAASVRKARADLAEVAR